MKIVSGALGLSITALALSGCGMFGSPSYQTYCLEEKENNGYDYMVVTEDEVCDMGMDDVEWYEGPIGLNIGDLAYVENDSVHSAKNRTSKNTIKPATSYPAYAPATRAPLVPQPTKICLKANAKPAPPAPKPAPPAPKPPAPAPAPKPVQPAPAPIKPAPVQTPPKAPVVVPPATIKPGC